MRIYCLGYLCSDREMNLPSSSAKAILLMGVAGAGKSTIGAALAAQLGFRFIEGDDFHSEVNRKKMSEGFPLNDEDRAPWLEAIRHELEASLSAGRSCVVACSALKERYRQILVAGLPVMVVFLKLLPEIAESRVRARSKHFFSPTLVASQFLALENPKEGLCIDASLPVDEILLSIEKSLTSTFARR